MATHARDIVNKMKKRVIALEDGRLVRDEEKGGYSIEIPNI
jgi:cell division transport system ATP-binding protein